MNNSKSQSILGNRCANKIKCCETILHGFIKIFLGEQVDKMTYGPYQDSCCTYFHNIIHNTFIEVCTLKICSCLPFCMLCESSEGLSSVTIPKPRGIPSMQCMDAQAYKNKIKRPRRLAFRWYQVDNVTVLFKRNLLYIYSKMVSSHQRVAGNCQQLSSDKTWPTQCMEAVRSALSSDDDKCEIN